MSDASLILSAKITLAQALLELGIRPTEEAFYWMLGLVWGESRFGQSPDWTIPNALNDETANPDAPPGPSNNWGAVRASGSAPFIWHHDRNANGSLGKFKFARFDSALDGAKHFVRVLARGQVPSVLNGGGTAHDLASAMYANHYFTGTQGSDADRINSYSQMILGGAAKVRGVVGAGTPSAADARRPVAPSAPVGVQVSLTTAAIAAGGVTAAVFGFRALSQTAFYKRNLQ